ncbi:hypothetical protein EVA_14971 [gut metagenome]|uniref:Uncharacterized protein n=1 Tax=gut metagenome TaxID=749906 RepID=J9FPP1_9ZZZZ
MPSSRTLSTQRRRPCALSPRSLPGRRQSALRCRGPNSLNPISPRLWPRFPGISMRCSRS